MPLPLILGIGAAVAGLAGVAAGVDGAVKMKEADDDMKYIKRKNKENVERYENKEKETLTETDKLGKKELEIAKSFDQFINVFKKIQNVPEGLGGYNQTISLNSVELKKLKDISVGADVLLGGLAGSALGTAGGFAAAGITTSAVMALGTASTGATIASLSGAAATNATLAALGGGAIAAGGGGMALGSAILGGATLGVDF